MGVSMGVVRGDVQLQGGVDADQQADRLDGQPLEPQGPQQGLEAVQHRLGEDGGPGVRGGTGRGRGVTGFSTDRRSTKREKQRERDREDRKSTRLNSSH